MIPAAFDGAAAGYDAEFTDSSVGRAQRRLVWEHLDNVLMQVPSPGDVLEINCGTGEDAVWLARRGCRVVATDISGAMLTVAAGKAARAGVQHAVTFARLGARDLEAGVFAHRFDLVLSNFGGLNCLSPDQMAGLADRLAEMVRPGGRVVLVVMPPFCLWETVWHLATLHPRAATRRWRSPVTAQVGAATFPIWYYGARRLSDLFAAAFDCVAVRPVGLAVPPSAMERAFNAWPRTLDVLESIDRRLGKSAPLAGLSDHLLIELRRRGCA